MEEIRLSIDTQAGTTTIQILRDRTSPTSYKEYSLSVSRREIEQQFTIHADDDQLQSVFKAIHCARVAPIIEQIPMLDQDSYELRFRSSAPETSYRWFATAPLGWEPLEEIAHLVLQFAMRYTGAFYL